MTSASELAEVEVWAERFAQQRDTSGQGRRMRILLDAYRAQGVELAENIGVIRMLRRQRDEAEIESASRRDRIDAALDVFEEHGWDVSERDLDELVRDLIGRHGDAAKEI